MTLWRRLVGLVQLRGHLTNASVAPNGHGRLEIVGADENVLSNHVAMARQGAFGIADRQRTINAVELATGWVKRRGLSGSLSQTANRQFRAQGVARTDRVYVVGTDAARLLLPAVADACRWEAPLPSAAVGMVVVRQLSVRFPGHYGATAVIGE